MDIAEPLEKSISVFEVRPGVTFPDLTVVRTPVARAALADIIKAFGIEKCFANYDADQDRVRNSVLRSLAERGRAPEIGELAEDLELPPICRRSEKKTWSFLIRPRAASSAPIR